MASGVNVKMGVSGVAQFKQSINTAKSTLKTLDAQLSLNEKQFKATGDAESYMTERAELLKVKLEQQKSVVSNAEKALEQMRSNGVERSSKAYQDLYQQMLKAKGEMIDTQNEMNGISTAGSEAANEVSGMNAQLKRIGNGVSFQNVTEGISKITSSMEAAARKAVQLGKRLLQSSMDSAHWADDVITRSTKFGVPVEQLQAMDNVAAYIDTDVDTIINAQKRIRKEMGNEKSADSMGAFAALGIDPTNTEWEDVFWKAGEALRNLSDDVEKEEYAQRLFGKSWQDLNPLFEAGRQEYEEMLSEQTVLTKKQVEALGKEDDAMQKMQQQIDLLKNQFWAGLAPAITEATNALSGLLEQFNLYLSTDEGQELLQQLGDTFSTLLKDLTEIDPDDIMNGLKGAMDSLQKGMEWIETNKDGIITALEAIGIAFGALKVGEVAFNVWRVVSGMKQLLNIGAGGGAGEGAGTAGAPSAAVGGGSALAGAAGIAAIGAGFAWAIDRRQNHAEEVRGTEENLAARTEGVNDLLTDYILAQRAAESDDIFNKSEEEVDAIFAKVQETYDALMGAENGKDALQAYSDWRQENALGNMDWELPEAINKMNHAAEELSGGTEAQKQSSSDMSGAATTLKGLPGVIEGAIISGMSRIRITVDGQQLGSTIEPYVSQQQGSKLYMQAR